MENKIAALRKRKGLKQKELAAALDIPTSRLGTWERGECELSFRDACNIADVLNCTLDELAGRSPVIASNSQTAQLINGFQMLGFEGRRSILEQLEFQIEKASKSMQDHQVPGVA